MWMVNRPCHQRRRGSPLCSAQLAACRGWTRRSARPTGKGSHSEGRLQEYSLNALTHVNLTRRSGEGRPRQSRRGRRDDTRLVHGRIHRLSLEHARVAELGYPREHLLQRNCTENGGNLLGVGDQKKLHEFVGVSLGEVQGEDPAVLIVRGSLSRQPKVRIHLQLCLIVFSEHGPL